MIYNNKYTFRLNYEDEIHRIDTPRILEDKSDFTTLDLKNLIKKKLKIQNDFILTLNNKMIPCNRNFSVSLLQYLPYQQIKIENPFPGINDSKCLDDIDVKFNLSDFGLFPQDNSVLKFKKSEFENSSISNLKNRFIENIRNLGADNNCLLNPYNLIFLTDQRYLTDDEDAFQVTRTPIIIIRRNNNDAVYPLNFILTNNKIVTKWYHKGTTFGQIAYDIFGEDYYKYAFFSENKSYEKIDYSTKVKKMIDINMVSTQFKIDNQFRIIKNDKLSINYSSNNLSDNINISMSDIENERDILYFYKIQQMISKSFSKKHNKKNYYLVEKYNFKAKITDYDNISKKNMQCFCPNDKNIYSVKFYKDGSKRQIYLKDSSTVFNLRYLISVYLNFEIENVIIFNYKDNDLKPLDDQIILKNLQSNITKYAFYVVHKDDRTVLTTSKNHDYNMLIYNNLESDTFISNLFINQNAETPTFIDDKHFIDVSPLPEGGKEDEYSTLLKSDKENDDYLTIEEHQSDKGYDLHKSDYHLTTVKTDLSPPETKKDNDIPSKKAPKGQVIKNTNKLKKAYTPKIVPQIDESSEMQNNNNNKVIEEKNKEIEENENHMGKAKKTERKDILNKSGVITELDYLTLTFLYNGKELVFYQPNNNENLNILESKICRFYDLNCKIDFYLENDPTKKSIKDVFFDTMEKMQRIMVLRTNDPIEKTIYYKIYGENDEHRIDDVKTVGELKRKIIKLHKRFKLNNINIIFGGKFLDDKVSLNKLSSPIDNEKNKIVLTIYQNKSIIDFSTTIVLKNDKK
ncbi:hypothetical protein M9Y10_016335 [Tritrichomonas musculus]|uniref:Ubiquitin-like domain-containing protein n=1 Tax=Tritrichomonas musculus TaxID=1915356 RepID=A0ABR2HVW6_9EUKA